MPDKELNRRILLLSADVSTLEDDVLYERVYSSVSVSRRKKTDLYRFRSDRNLSLGAEFLLMEACREYQIDYFSCVREETEDKKPYFRDCPFHFNLSHSGEHAICVMSNFEVGCDIEQIKDSGLKVASRYFAREENTLIESCKSADEKIDLFYRVWTLKESYMKCTGLGFKIPLDAFAVSFDGAAAFISRPDDAKGYTFFEPDPPEGYRLALCIKDLADEAFLDFRQVLIK